MHQFVRIGANSMIGGMSGVEKDVIPYGSVIGNRAELGGLNLVGLKRRGFGRDVIHALRGAYRMIFQGEGSGEGSGEGRLAERAARAGEAYPQFEPVQQVVAFIRAGGARNFCTPRDG